MIFTYSLDALDTEASVEADDDSQWHHDYVNVAPPRPPKFKMAERAVRQEGPAMPSRRSTPVYVNVYSLGRRRPGDVLQSGRWVTTQNSGGENFGQPSCLKMIFKLWIWIFAPKTLLKSRDFNFVSEPFKLPKSLNFGAKIHFFSNFWQKKSLNFRAKNNSWEDSKYGFEFSRLKPFCNLDFSTLKANLLN